MSNIPLFVRKFAVDFIETAAAALLALTVFGDAASFAHAVAVAVGTAALAAARREFPDFQAWLKGFFGIPD